MQKSLSTRVLTAALALVTGQILYGQSAYFQAVTNLNPAGYWPLNETVQPPAPFASSLVASNSGTLGRWAMVTTAHGINLVETLGI